MKPMRVYETSIQCAGKGSGGNVVLNADALIQSVLPRTDETVSFFNTSAINAYVKYHDGRIRTIPPTLDATKKRYMNLSCFTDPKSGLQNTQDRIFIEITEKYMPMDIAVINRDVIMSRQYSETNLREHTLSDKYAKTQVAMDTLRARGGMPGMSHVIVSAHNVFDQRPDEPIITRSLAWVDVSYLQEDGCSPVYLKEHDVMVAYGDVGFSRLRKMPHPRSSEYTREIIEHYVATTEDSLFDCVMKKVAENPTVNDWISGWKCNGHFPYMVIIIDNDRKIGDRWYLHNESVHVVKAKKMPHAKSGVYIHRSQTVSYDSSNNESVVTYYPDPESVPGITLYRSYEQAITSVSYLEKVEQERKIKSQTQQMELKEREYQYSKERSDRDMQKLVSEKETAEKDLELLREKAKRDTERMERESAEATRRFEQERERWERDRSANEQKFKHDQERHRQEKEAWEQRFKGEKSMEKMKFFTATAKVMMIAIPAGIAIFKTASAWLAKRMAARALKVA